ncbi:MAG: hypothetical protein ACR2MP_00345 [Streptosporangiaceae bacterium]
MIRLPSLFDAGSLRPLDEPARRKLVEAFAAAPPGRGQHGNIPL